jgi:hypothetical protein
MAASGATAFFAKRLAANDNSKNQIYLGGGFDALNVIPHGDVETDGSDLAGSVRDRAKTAVTFFWLCDEGLSPAPKAQLILYPKYPEVRMSGFLAGAKNAPGELMRSRDEGRVMFFGICPDRRVIGYVVDRESPLIRELDAGEPYAMDGMFLRLDQVRTGIRDTRQALLDRLRTIHRDGWIASCKLGPDGPRPYQARNGGGYTLEAALGISPNGLAEPDFLGWEIKQYGVTNFETYRAKSPVTLMTPEPTGGFYRDAGPEAFVRRYGYPDQSGKADRINFGGVYAVGREAPKLTGLTMTVAGFDDESGKITDMGGGIRLVDKNGAPAATWGFDTLLPHWNRKHARACYVPSLTRGPPPEYSYGGQVELCEGTDFLLLLRAIVAGAVYYDPALKLENENSVRSKLKKRSQFRVRHNDLPNLYRKVELSSL